MPTKASDVMTNIYQVLGLPQGAALPDFISRQFPDTHYYFKINQLQQKEPTEANLFADEDFIFYPEGKKPRRPVELKMGSLFITFCAGGKASYTLNVKFIDKETQQIRLMPNVDGIRHPYFQFSDIVPFSLGDSTTTIEQRNITPETQPIISCANQIRAMLTQLALNEPLHENQFQQAARDFFAAVDGFNRSRAEQTHAASSHAIASAGASRPAGFFQEPHAAHPESHDLEYFGAHFEHEPQNEYELAAKIATDFILNLGINEQQIKEIIQQYLHQTQKSIDELNKDWIDNIMVILVDKGRYCLKTLLPEEEPGLILQEIIDEIRQEQKSQHSPATP